MLVEETGAAVDVTPVRSRQIEGKPFRRLPRQVRHRLGVSKADVRASKGKMKCSDDDVELGGSFLEMRRKP